MIMLITLLIFAILSSAPVKHQLDTTNQPIQGQITDKDTGEPVGYAHLLIMGTSQGTASNAEGRFSLPHSLLDDSDVEIRVSAVGYQTSYFKLEDLFEADSNQIEISLPTLVYEQDSAVVTSSKMRAFRENNIGFWWRMGFNRTATGIMSHNYLDEYISISLAQRVDLKEPGTDQVPAWLQQLDLFIGSISGGDPQHTDSLSIRLRITDIDDHNLPGETQYLRSQLIQNVAAESGRLRFDLSDLDVRIPVESFFIITELIIPDPETYHGLFPLYNVNNSGKHPYLTRFRSSQSWEPRSRFSFELHYDIRYLK
ncbi:MAG: carboxypeptidase-like regulatory domain-containing protein [Balneolia bacterium]|nr:carboxypeptidase-like regulatory domain-containing protein [Balneolia bacterium]